MGEHTKGKWDAQEGLLDLDTKERRRHVWGSVWGQGWIVAEVLKNADGNHEANARLIAAAPELLEALERVEQRARESGECPFCRQPPEVGCVPACQLTAARAAIKKARGEG